MLGLSFIAVMPSLPRRRRRSRSSNSRAANVTWSTTPPPLWSTARTPGRRTTRAFHGPIHVRRTRHRLAGKQQHRRVDLRAAEPRTAPRYRRGSCSARARAAPAPPSGVTRRYRPVDSETVRCRSGGVRVLAGVPANQDWNLSRPVAAPASKGSAGPGSNRPSSPRWSTGWCRCRTRGPWRPCARARPCWTPPGRGLHRDQPVGSFRD